MNEKKLHSIFPLLTPYLLLVFYVMYSSADMKHVMLALTHSDSQLHSNLRTTKISLFCMHRALYIIILHFLCKDRMFVVPCKPKKIHFTGTHIYIFSFLSHQNCM